MPPSEAERLAGSLMSRGTTLACAESCTGGLIGAALTNVPGASEFFLGSAVTYSNDAKEKVLGVSHDTLMSHGAVSEETVREMARGATELYGADHAIAVTGIAGPGGATPGKPVGLVYIAVTDGPRIVVSRNLFEGDRASVRRQTVSTALTMMLEMSEGRL